MAAERSGAGLGDRLLLIGALFSLAAAVFEVVVVVVVLVVVGPVVVVGVAAVVGEAGELLRYRLKIFSRYSSSGVSTSGFSSAAFPAALRREG